MILVHAYIRKRHWIHVKTAPILGDMEHTETANETETVNKLTGPGPLRVAIFGASRGVGRQATELALQAGHTVTALTRNPASLDLRHSRLRVVAGDVTNAASVRDTLQGAQLVLCTLGMPPGNRDGVRAAGTEQIITAMRRAGIRRLVCLSMLGAGDSLSGLPFLLKHVIVGMWLRHVVRDHNAQEQLVENSGLDWTIVRPPFLTDGPRTDQFAHGFTSGEKGLAMKISREDVAAFMLRQAHSEHYLGRSVGVSYRAQAA